MYGRVAPRDRINPKRLSRGKECIGWRFVSGFLRPGTSDDAASNFGLLDQTAALVWLRDNIAKFGGDPDSMTLVGHGTGAIFANLLLISPVANNKGW